MRALVIDDRVRERFKRFVQRDGPGGCWLWTGCKQAFGHGLFRMPTQVRGRHGKLEKAHRASWVLHHGAIPDGVCVLHRCDVPACVNPAHLFLGTHADNAHDRDAKGRHVRLIDQAHGNTRFPLHLVKRWKEQRDDGVSIRTIAAQHGVAYSSVWQALRRRRGIA